MTTTENLDRLKARHRGHRGVAKKYVQEARALVTGESRDEPVIVRIKRQEFLKTPWRTFSGAKGKKEGQVKIQMFKTSVKTPKRCR